MIDLEARLGESLRARAERGVEVDRLRTGAMARARTIRRRRNLLGGLAVVALVAAGAVAAPLALSGGDGSRRTGRPTVVGVPATVPGPGIASNPAALHFDLDPATLEGSGHQAVSTGWISAATYERAILYDADGNQWATVLLARTQSDLDAAVNPPPPSGPTRAAPERGPEQDTTVDGHPATIQRMPQFNRVYWLLRWQPADGVYAAVVSTGEEQSLAYAVAGALRLNQVQRCVAPLRLTELPAGAVWVECQTDLRPTAVNGSQLVRSGLTLRLADGHKVLIWLEEAHELVGPDADAFHPDRNIAGHPTDWLEADPRGLWSPQFGAVSLFIGGYNEENAAWLTEEQAVWLAERMEVATDLANPETWPDWAVG